MPWTTAQDIVSRWVGEPKPADEALLEQLIDDAETIVRGEYPTIEDRIGDDLATEQLVLVVSRMVIRHLRNPDGTRQMTESEGPFSRNRTFAGEVPGALWLTDEDRRMLGYPAGRQQAFTVALTPPEPVPYGMPDGW